MAETVKSKRELFILTVSATVIIIAVAIMFYRNSLMNVPNTSVDENDCGYENAPKSAYLDQYVVQKGDSVLSIARDQMGDVSRVTELIELNKDVYPDLSLNNSFLEIGWIVYLTPKEFGITTGKLVYGAGKITGINGNRVTLKNYINQESYGHHYMDESTIYVGKTMEEIAVGDCVNVITDLGSQSRILMMTFQQ
jgi:hypothetical protein